MKRTSVPFTAISSRDSSGEDRYDLVAWNEDGSQFWRIETFVSYDDAENAAKLLARQRDLEWWPIPNGRWLRASVVAVLEVRLR